MTSMLKNAHVLLLGGGGLVGSAIAKDFCRLPRHLRPERLILAALTKEGAERAKDEVLQQIPPPPSNLEIVPTWGDVFVRSALAFQNEAPSFSRSSENPNTAFQVNYVSAVSRRAMMLEDLYGDFGAAYERSHLVATLREFRPHIVVDCVNTATIFAYRNIFDASTKLQESMDDVLLHYKTNDGNDDFHQQRPSSFELLDVLKEDAELAMLSQTGPQLIRHTRMLARAAEEVGVQQYFKIGTTGTGGMGMNVPYTHSEDRPSQLLMAKTEAAFGHSGLLMLWSLTPGAPSVKEIKPAAAIGYRGIDIREVQDRFGNTKILQSRVSDLNNTQTMNLREEDHAVSDSPSTSTIVYPEISPLRMTVIDMGENGVFTHDEFMTITAPDQMEMITPEEISEQVMEEVLGSCTGHNVLAAMRGSLLGPGYRAGIERMKAEFLLRDQDHSAGGTMIGTDGTEKQATTEMTVATAPSIALGKLGPPQISKLLFEANLLMERFGTYRNLIAADAQQVADEFATNMQESSSSSSSLSLQQSLRHVAPSVGVPILLSGNMLIRGPNISIPALSGHSTKIPCPRGEDLDEIANLGWIDLRAPNLEVWQARARTLIGGQESDGDGVVKKSETDKKIVPSDVVAWILSVELGGHRDFIE